MHEAHDLNNTNISSDQFLKNKLHLSISKLINNEPIISNKNLSNILIQNQNNLGLIN